MRHRLLTQLSQLFKGLTVALAAVGAIVIVWLSLELLQLMASVIFITPQPGNKNPFASALVLGLTYARLLKLAIRLLIANTVEIGLVWLVVLLNLLSIWQGQIISLVLLIWAGIAFFLVYSILP